MATYRNQSYSPGNPMYGPEFYETGAKPQEYRGHLIYNRIQGDPGRGVWDVVLDGQCVGQLAGPRGARDWIDESMGAPHG